MSKILKHHEPGNYAKFQSIHHTGMLCGWASDRMVRVNEGDFVEYSYPGPEDESSPGPTAIGRVVCKALAGGDGTPLDPHHLAVIELGSGFRFGYLRFIHPKWVNGVTPALNKFFRWFVNSPQFVFNGMDMILRMERYGSLSEEYLEVNENWCTSPSKDMSWWPSRFVSDKLLQHCNIEFEDWLWFRGDRPIVAFMDEGRTPFEASKLVDLFLNKKPQRLNDHYLVKEHAKEIGEIVCIS